MNERFGPNRFERLAQGSEARIDQIEAARQISTQDSIPTSKVRSHERATIFATVPLLLTILLAACSGGGGKEETKTTSPENFADNLPTTLRQVCELYVSSANLGPDEGENNRRLANTMIGVYLDSQQQHPDARALYLMGLGFILSVEAPSDFDNAKSSFRLAVERGLPKTQKELASRVVETFDKLEEGADIEEEVANLSDSTFDIVDDLDANVCPE